MRYTTRPKATYWDDSVEELIINPETITVDDEDCIYTGLLDRHGNELVKMRDPIGFKLK